MNSKSILIRQILVIALFGGALCQQQQQQSPNNGATDNRASNQQHTHEVNSPPPPAPVYGTGNNNYRSSHPGSGTTSGSAPSYSNQQTSYPAVYNRDSYSTGSGRDLAGNPIFGIASNADFALSAYFGQIFWGFVAVAVTLFVSIWIIRFFAGTDVVGGLVDKIRDSSAAKGKALDLDGVTNMVYEALETYGKWAAKEVRHAVDIGGKARH